jgi:hypothetical protein
MFHPIQSHPEVNSEIEIDRNSASASAPIAYCSDRNRLVVVTSRIIYTSNSCDPNQTFHEISFSIDVASLDDSYLPFSTQDRNIAMNYVPELIRGDIIHIAAGQYMSLIDAVRPDYVYRVTKSTGSNMKMLRKHYFLTKKIQSCGYAIVEEGLDAIRRNYWLMERSTPAEIDREYA